MPTPNDLELARLKAAHSRRGPTRSARQTAAARLESCAIEAERHKKNIEHVEFHLSLSAALQQLAVEAILQAVTMGAARMISAGIMNTRLATPLLCAAEGGGASSAAVRGLAARTLPRGAAATSDVVAHAAASTLGRLGAAILMASTRGIVSGQLKDDQGRFCMGLLACVAGSLARPAALAQVRALPTSMPGIAGQQGRFVALNLARFEAQALTRAEPGAVSGSLAGTIDQPAFDAMIAALHAADRQGRQVTDHVDRVTASFAAAVAKVASHQEKAIGDDAARRAQATDSSARVPFLARHFSGIEPKLHAVVADYASACARWELWRGVLQTCHQADMGRMQTNDWIRDTVKDGRRRVSGR
ncbi:MAG: hypothetical protein HKN71_13250 [Gemmatimonadetes bacterium]|nr:hypothetical protein [Gemmatimonadota bacterium]